MYFSFGSLLSVLALALPLSTMAAPVMESDSGLAARSNWHDGQCHKVTVGKDGKLRYDPQYVYAKPGDWVEFQFHPKNHTVTESSFDKPCYKLENSKGDPVFTTGFVPVKDEKGYLPTRTYEVKDDKPHWFYCGQVGHCPAGMVFAINPPKYDNTFEEFQKKAIWSGK